MFERILDWLALRGRRDTDRTYPTSPPQPELTPEEEARAREQLAGAERDVHMQPPDPDRDDEP